MLKIRLANPIDIRQTQEDNLLGVTLATVPGIEAGMFDQEVFDGSTGQRRRGGGAEPFDARIGILHHRICTLKCALRCLRNLMAYADSKQRMDVALPPLCH